MSIADQLESSMSGQQGELQPGNRAQITLAKVTNITDDKKFNRVKCLPIGADATEETDWCYVMAPMSGPDRGMFFFPTVGDLVVLAYLDGDVHRPLVLGGFWNTESKPPFTIQEGKVTDYAIRMPSKAQLSFHEEEKKYKITLVTPAGTTLVLDDEQQAAQLQDKDGKNALTIDWKNGAVTLAAEKKLTLSAGKTSIVLEEGGNITQKGSGTLSLEGTNIQAKASSKLAQQGGTVEVKSNGTLDLNATGPATLKGITVKIN